MRAEPRPTILRPVPPHRPLPKTPHFPAIEQEVLERWRERDIFRESVRRRQGAEPFVFYEGPPTANGRPGSHHVLARVFKDIFPRYQTMLGKYVERKGGWDCHGLPVEIAVEQKLGFTSKDDIERYGIAEFNAAVPRVGVRVPRGLDGADRAHRLLGRPRAPLPHARPRLHRVGVVGAEDDVGQGPAVRGPQGRALLRALRHRAVLPRGRAGLRGRRGPVDLREVPRHRPAGALRDGDRLLVWTTTPWTLLSNAARRRRPRAHLRAHRATATCSPRRSSTRVLGEDARVADRFPGARHARHALRAAVRRSSRRRSTARRATPCCPATSSAPTTAPASSTPRSRSARTTTGSARSRASRSSTRSGSTAPTTSASARTPGAGSRRPTPTSSRTCASAGGCCARRPTCTPTRTAGAAARRCSTTPSRPGTSARRSCATACWPPTRPSTGTRSTSSTGASGAGWRTTSTGRSRASATGARRCRSGAARTATRSAWARSPSWPSARARRSRTRTAPTSTRRRGRARTAASRCAACPR